MIGTARALRLGAKNTGRLHKKILFSNFSFSVLEVRFSFYTSLEQKLDENKKLQTVSF